MLTDRGTAILEGKSGYHAALAKVLSDPSGVRFSKDEMNTVYNNLEKNICLILINTDLFSVAGTGMSPQLDDTSL